MPRKGRARRFREARRLKQGYDDDLFREGSGTLADLGDDDESRDEDEPEASDDAWDDWDDEDDDAAWDPDREE